MALLDNLFGMDSLRRFAAARDGTSIPGAPPTNDSSASMFSGLSGLPDAAWNWYADQVAPVMDLRNKESGASSFDESGMQFPDETTQNNLPNSSGVAPPLPAPINVASHPIAQVPNTTGYVPRGAMAQASPQEAAQPPAPGAGFLSRLSNSLAQHPATLLALGAGLSGAPSFGTGMSRAFAAAVPASQQDIATNMRVQGIGETYKALVAQGVSPQEALAAVYNPEVLKAMIPRLYGKTPSWGVVGHDQFGNPRYGFIDTYDQTVLPAESVTKPRVGSVEDALRLPKGSHFIDPNGIERIR